MNGGTEENGNISLWKWIMIKINIKIIPVDPVDGKGQIF